MPVLDLSKFSFSAEEIRTVNDLLFDDLVQSPEITMLATIYPGIVYNREIGFIGRGGLVGVANQGCSPTAQDFSISTRKIVWTPKRWEILIELCYKDLESTAALYSLKTGVDMADFSSSDYINIITEVLGNSIKDFIIRSAFFGDTTAATVANSGIITSTLNVNFFNIIDGFFKQMEAQIADVSTQRVTISENANTTYATQVLTPSNVVNTYLPGLIYQADTNLRAKTNAAIICTQSFYDAYDKGLKALTIQATYDNLVNGQKTLTYNGVKLVSIPRLDQMIKEYHDTTTAYRYPHRAIYYSPDNFAFGVDTKGTIGDLDVWYEKKTRQVCLQSMGEFDAKILDPKQFVYAY